MIYDILITNSPRYRPRNLLLYSITPGPKEFNSDQLQHFMKNYVDDLLELYDNGIFVKTPEHPNGRRIRVILVAVCCDHPAMCKVCGFGNHSKEEGFCTRCHIPKSKLATEDAMHYDSKSLSRCTVMIHARLLQSFLQEMVKSIYVVHENTEIFRQINVTFSTKNTVHDGLNSHAYRISTLCE